MESESESESSTHNSNKQAKTAAFPGQSVIKVMENVELLTSILCLLPTKSVARFKCVSKHWLSLLSHSYFSLLHSSLSPPSSLLLFPLPNNPSLLHSIPLLSTLSTFTPSTSLTFTNDPDIIHSSNGLLLCSSGSLDGLGCCLFYIFNPTTNKFNTLPPPPPDPASRPLSIFTKINLAFDPSRSPFYKVLLLRKADRGATFFRLDIYCSRTGEWSVCGDRVQWRNFEVFCNGVYVNGAFHWASKRDGFFSFHVDRECFQPMPPLPGFRDGSGTTTVRYLGESTGKLYLVDSRDFEFDVFEMGRDNSAWVLRYQINLALCFGVVIPCSFTQPLCGGFGVERTKVSLISVVSEGGKKGGDLCLVLHVPGKILSYNMESGSIKVIRDEFVGDVESMIPALVKNFRGYQVVESLACV